jgi:Flp pilus assembly protein TadD
LEKYQRAIKDFNSAIRLKPNYADAYDNRGKAYMKLRKTNLGCRDLNKACKLGNCKGLEFAKDRRDCR